jgi:hypothetical protein
MPMREKREEIVEAFRTQGFRLACQSSALAFLIHPAHPGVEVRIGTRFVVIECDGKELYRAGHQEFDLATAMQRLIRLDTLHSEPRSTTLYTWD